MVGTDLSSGKGLLHSLQICGYKSVYGSKGGLQTLYCLPDLQECSLPVFTCKTVIAFAQRSGKAFLDDHIREEPLLFSADCKPLPAQLPPS